MKFTNKAPYAVALILSLLITSCKSTSEANINTTDAVLQQTNPKTQLNSLKATDKQSLAPIVNNYRSSKKIVPPEVIEVINLAVAAKAVGDLNVARQLLEQLTIANPKLSVIPVYLGDIALEKGSTNLAKEYYQRAITINANNYFALNRLATLQRKTGQFDLAETSYRLALASWQNFAPAHLNLGILLDLYKGKKAEALAHYKKYQALTNSQSRQVNGWIVDISRQLQQSKRG